MLNFIRHLKIGGIMPRPTENQIAFLKKSGIIPPPTKAACRSLIAYIVKGNATIGKSPKERIDIIKNNQKKWVGKKITHRCGSKKGRILYIMARTKDEVLDARRDGVEKIKSSRHEE